MEHIIIFVYILTNKNKTVLYVGITNNLKRRLFEHKEGVIKNEQNKFTARYNVHYLIYFERLQFIEAAFKREIEIKKWNRVKKEKLINSFNPNWNFLNEEV